jgi:LCP family protein required for cell wall assembly
VLALNIFVVVGCLAGAGALVYGKDQLDGRLQTEKFEPTTPAPTAPGSTVVGQSTLATVPQETFAPADPQAQNFLITGSDNNACYDEGSPWAGAAEGRDNIGSRSDTIMVIRVDPLTRAAAVLSFPRDLWVSIPGKSKNRINTAYVQNDYSLLAQTLAENFGIAIDHYIQVDFCAFKKIVDAVGGVSVPFDTRVIDPHVGLDVPAGCHLFTGDEGLAYVRSRHLTAVATDGTKAQDRASDLGRISRQQDFLRRVLQKALDKGLMNPTVARALITELQTNIVTEQGFSIDDMLTFAGVMHDVPPDSIRTYQIQTYGKVIQGSSVLVQVQNDNMAAILAVFQGTAPLATAPAQVADPSTSVGGTGTVVGQPATTTTAVIVGPDDFVVGDIVPSKDIKC